MKTHQARRILMEVYSGEIVQIWNYEAARYKWRLPDVALPKTVYIRAGEALKSSTLFLISSGDTVRKTVETWLADISLVHVSEIMRIFDLKKYQGIIIKKAEADLTFRLHLLKAILGSARIVVIAESYGVYQLTTLVIAAREFAETYHKEAGTVPAFVVLDEGEATGVALVADRILEPVEGKMEELTVDF